MQENANAFHTVNCVYSYEVLDTVSALYVSYHAVLTSLKDADLGRLHLLYKKDIFQRYNYYNLVKPLLTLLPSHQK